MKLAVLSPIGYGRAGADVGLEGVEAERDDLHAGSAVAGPNGEEEGRLTVPSGDRSLVTVPWGQPLPEVEALMILIRSPPGLPDSNSMGLAATRAGASKARAAERIFVGWWVGLGGREDSGIGLGEEDVVYEARLVAFLEMPM